MSIRQVREVHAINVTFVTVSVLLVQCPRRLATMFLKNVVQIEIVQIKQKIPI
jgi:hypothetical protein